MALAGIHPHHRIAVGVSGGPDSMALCVLAAAWKKAVEGGSGRKSEDKGSVSPGFVEGLLGVVVDHGLRLESAEEAQLVRARVHGMGAFQSELQKLIYACRLTRVCVSNACNMAIKQSVTTTEYGYAVIDLEKLDPQNVDDLCLSQYLACVLQGALTVAGCYLCAFPRSKSTKILVCCSADLMESFSGEMSYKCSYEEQPPPVPEIDHVALEARLYSNQFLQCSSIPFLSHKSSTDVLNRAKDLNIIGDFSLGKLLNLQTEEHQKFITTTEHKHEEQYLEKTSFPDVKVLCLWPGETCHFMSRFLITWNTLEAVPNGICSYDSQKGICQHCAVNQDGSLAVRHMFDTDWLFLAEVSRIHSVEENQNVSKVSSVKLKDDELLKHSNYLQLSATKALEALRSIPASARRTLPVLTNSQGDILSIPGMRDVSMRSDTFCALVSGDSCTLAASTVPMTVAAVTNGVGAGMSGAEDTDSKSCATDKPSARPSVELCVTCKVAPAHASNTLVIAARREDWISSNFCASPSGHQSSSAEVLQNFRRQGPHTTPLARGPRRCGYMARCRGSH
ncbi:hypothetical protein ACQ4PT_047022 [Festuca glaucescens]